MAITKNTKLVCDSFQIFPEKGVEAIAYMVSVLGCCEDCPHLKDCDVVTDREVGNSSCEAELIKFMKEE